MIPLVLPTLLFVLWSPSVQGDINRSQGVLNAWTVPSSQAGHSAEAGGWVEEPLGYSGPIAVPEVLPDGSLADVPEVAAARVAHLTAVQAAASDPRAADGDDGSYNPYKYGDDRYYHHDQNPHNTGENQAAWQVEQYTPLPNPHAKEAAARAWRE